MHTVVRQHRVQQYGVQQHGVRQRRVQQHRVRRGRADRGMSTAEYAVGLITACGFAAMLHRIITSDEIHRAVAELVTRALSLAG